MADTDSGTTLIFESFNRTRIIIYPCELASGVNYISIGACEIGSFNISIIILGFKRRKL